MNEDIWGEATTRHLKEIAAGIFASRGVDFSTARRAVGWSNATWIAGGLALRLATSPGNERIRCEAMLAALLPPEVGYPTPIETGVTDGYEWSLAREIPGQCLGEVWPALRVEERTTAVTQLWEHAQAVHRVDAAAAAGLARERAWFNSNNAAEAAAATDRLEQQGLFTTKQAGVLRATLWRFWNALSAATPVLNHGDLTLDNAMWHAGQVVSVLDFEFAVIAPVELDLNTWLKHSFAPWEDEENPQQGLRQAAAACARPVLAQPGSAERLLGYAILLEQWQLENWLAHPDGEDPLEQWDPYRRLLSLADGEGGYLRQVLQEMRYDQG